ncbi:MAG: ThiF family adenylyltransferase, partial [Planctomycetes bacterium]|nr:ThiF family adenylyltransferase [Planctomycetota bacterium]
MYLAAAGVGTLGIADRDVVDFSNLQRQIIHGTKDVGRPKVVSAQETIADLNPDVAVEVHETFITSDNALAIMGKYDVIIDGTDNFPTRYLTNDAAVMLKKPNIYGSIFRFEGQATVFAPHLGGPCYRCLYPEPPPPGLAPSCAEGGVLGILPGTIALLQATECIKLLTGIGETLVGRLVMYDALALKFRELKLRRVPSCPMCGDHPTITKLIDYQEFCGLTRGGQPPEPGVDEINPTELKMMLDEQRDFLLLDVREPHEHEIARIPGSRLIPLGQVEARAAELDAWKNKPIVVHCKMGGRSRKAIGMLKAKGFTKLKNLYGGILQWAEQVDPTVRKY